MTTKTYQDVQAELNALISDLHAAMDDGIHKKEGLVNELTELIFRKQIEARVEYEEDLRENLMRSATDNVPHAIGECLAVILKEYYNWAVNNLKPECNKGTQPVTTVTHTQKAH